MLTDAQIAAAPLPTGTTTARLGEGGGLFLLLTSKGRTWRFRYKPRGRPETMCSLGKYPDVSIAQAHAIAEDYRECIKRGEDLNNHRRSERTAADLKHTTFGQAATEYNARRAEGKTAKGALDAKTIDRDRRNYGYSAKLHGRAISTISRRDLLAVCQAQAEKTPDSGHRLAKWIAAVFAYAFAQGYADESKPDPTQQGGTLTADLPKAPDEHRAAVTDPEQVKGLMRVVDGSDWLVTTAGVARALQLLARTAVRVNELVGMQWREVDLDGKETRNAGHATWVVPRERMKGGKRDKRVTDHVVPLSRQAVAILREQHKLTGHLEFVFPHYRSDKRHMTPNALPNALLSLGYRGQHTAHGFRSMFATLCREELNADSEIVERQLGHRVGSSVQQAYDRAARIAPRRELMQAYSDLLERLRGDL